MADSKTSPVPSTVRIVVALLIMKAALPVVGEVLQRLLVEAPLPFTWGLLSFLLPAVLLPLIIAWAFIRSPAAGFWATLAYAGLAATVSGLLILTPKIVTGSFVIPDPDPQAEARAFEQTWRIISIGASVLLAVFVLRPSVFRWVNARELQLRPPGFPSHQAPVIPARAAWIVPLVAGAIVPTATAFAVQRFVGNIPPGNALMDILMEHMKGRALLLDLFSIVPFAILAGTAFKNARHMSLFTLWSVTIGGLAGIIALMVPMYYMGWETIYNDVRGDEKSTGALVFFFTPLYCIATMLAGMLIGWVTARYFRKGIDDLIEDHT
jgi:hypothetical protein